jgi:Hypothetical glycosyl hydrolase family 15
MRLTGRHARRILALGATLLCAAVTTANASADTAGTVHFVRSANTEFNQFTTSPSSEQQAWLRTHMWRMMVWSPYFDAKTSWYQQGWVYKDAYAIYRGSSLASAHPDWILKSSSGANLYIPFGCSGGSCPQYAGDITNPAFRHYWIEEARSELAHGYRGLFIDDVNMEERVGNGEGAQAAPVSPASGETVSAAAWRSALGQFMAEVRAAFPSAEIAHNALWFADSDAGTNEPSIRKEIESANYILLERGVNDSGLTGGSGPWSLSAFFSFIDQVHALGRGVVLDGSSGEPHGMEYSLASYFLVSTGNDAVSGSGQTPTNWWSGWNVNLGEANGARYSWDSVLRRDYTGGMALVNPPGSPTRTIPLPTPMQELNGKTVTSVTLPAASGVVLTGSMPEPPPVPVEPAPEVPTETIVETAPVSSGGGSTGSGSTGTGSGSTGSGSTGSGSTGSGSTGSGSTGSGSTGSGSSGGSTGGSHSPHPRRHHHAQVRHSSRHARARRAARRAAAHKAAVARVSGLVLRARQGKVTIEISRKVHGHWIVVKRVTTNVNGSGRFVRLLALHSGLHYRVRAIYAGGAGYRPSRSRYRTLVLHTR